MVKTLAQLATAEPGDNLPFVTFRYDFVYGVHVRVCIWVLWLVLLLSSVPSSRPRNYMDVFAPMHHCCRWKRAQPL